MIQLLTTLVGQTETSTIVTEGTVGQIGPLLAQGSGWAAAALIIGLVVRVVRLVKLTSLMSPNVARIVTVVMTMLMGIAAGMAEQSLVIALEAIVAGVMGLLGAEAALRKTKAEA